MWWSTKCGEAPNVVTHQMWWRTKCGDAPNVVTHQMWWHHKMWWRTKCGDTPNVLMHQIWRYTKYWDTPNVMMVFMFFKISHGFLRFFMVFMGLCFVSIMFCGPCWSGGPVGLVGPWVWWAHGSGGFCWLLIAKSPTLRGPTCQGVLGLVSSALMKITTKSQKVPKWSQKRPKYGSDIGNAATKPLIHNLKGTQKL